MRIGGVGFLVITLPTPLFYYEGDEKVKTMQTSLVSSTSVFNFNAEHNGVACIVSTRPEDQGTEQQVWFTRQMLCKIYGIKSLNTIDNHVELLIKRGVVTDVTDLTSVMMPDSLGRECIKTTLYDLKVFNLLAMRLDTDRAWEMKERFNDVLVKEETKQNTLPVINKEDKLILLTVKSLNVEDRIIALGELKDLWTEEANKKTETANRRAFSAMGTASAKSKENTKLKTENEDLKARLQESTTYLCVKAIPWLSKYFIIPKEKENDSVYAQIGRKMTALSKKLNYELKDIPDPRYENGVHSYHIDVIEAFRKQLDNDSTILSKYRK